MTRPKILVFSASIRKDSLNQKLASLVTRRLKARDVDVTELNLAKYPLPIYNGDLEATDGLPPEALLLHEQLRSHDAVFIASPEYNSSISPLLINLLAWVSRVTEHGGMDAAFAKSVFAIGSASPGGFGGYRGLMALRQVLELQFMAHVLSAMLTVPAAHVAFDESDSIRNERSNALLQKIVDLLASIAPARP
jgi:chromate reductase, NAD(P)H dehydrogenase (quinone)